MTCWSLQKLANIAVDVLHIKDHIKWRHLVDGGTWALAVAGRAGAVQVPMMDQEQHEGSAARP